MKITKKRVINTIFILTFLFEGYISVNVPFMTTNSSFLVLPSFTVINIAVFYNFMEEKDLFIITLITAFLYDFIYIGNIGIYMLTYALIVLSAKYLYYYLGERFINALLVSGALIFIKEILLGFIYYIILDKNVSIQIVAYRIVRSVGFNALYVIILYVLVNFIFKKFFRK